MRKEQFEEGEFYHIYNRGVDKRQIFLNDREMLRFIHALYIFNNFLDIPARFNLISLTPKELLTPIEPHVEIIAGCLMPNHYHLLLTPKRKDGISKFFHKVGLSHTNYFNKVHERSGRLFESTFKAKHVDSHEYANYLTEYIHLNPIALYRTKSGTEKALETVKGYKWSTLPIYLGGKSQFSLLVNTSFRQNLLGLSAPEYNDLVEDIYSNSYRT
ncbi:MAG: transposase [Candidatus Sungbacteria bacterium]|nr:transposase [Candidatus Sungbacteria bacterium]